jgi:hypothetical protein
MKKGSKIEEQKLHTLFSWVADHVRKLCSDSYAVVLFGFFKFVTDSVILIFFTNFTSGIEKSTRSRMYFFENSDTF